MQDPTCNKTRLLFLSLTRKLFVICKIFGVYYLGYLVFVQIVKTQIIDTPSCDMMLLTYSKQLEVNF